MHPINYDFQTLIKQQPITPYIRAADHAVRNSWIHHQRRILDYLLVFIQKGECLFTINNIKYSLKVGDFCLMQPNDLIVLQGIEQTITPFVHFDIFYNPDRELSFSPKSGQTDLSEFSHLMQPRLNDYINLSIPALLKPTKHSVLRDCLYSAINDWQQGSILSIWEAHHAIDQLILELFKQYFVPNSLQERSSRQLDWFNSYFSLRISEPILIGELAQKAGLSVSGFAKLFKQTYNESPYRYMLKLRIQHAEALLRQSHLKLERIAEYCGFADIHHFSKAFKNMIGISPGQYRIERKSD